MVFNCSCARLFSAALTTDSQVVTFTSWGRPFVLRSSHFSSSPSPNAHGSLPIQVECGWDFAAVITQSGDVFVYWPRLASGWDDRFSERLARHVRQKDTEFDELEGPERKVAKALLDENSGAVKCWVWSVDGDSLPEEQIGEPQDNQEPHDTGGVIMKLPDLPTYELPDLHLPGTEEEAGTRLVKIAGLDCQIFGLTNKGHVVRYTGLINEAALTTNGGKWEYVSLSHLLESRAIVH